MKLVVPFTIPCTRSTCAAASVSCMTRITGTTPPTAASKRSCTPAARAEDHRRSRDAVVVVRHRVAVRAGRGDHEHVAGARLVEVHVAYQDVARLAVLAGHRAEPLAARPVGDLGLVTRAVEHRAEV